MKTIKSNNNQTLTDNEQSKPENPLYEVGPNGETIIHFDEKSWEEFSDDRENEYDNLYRRRPYKDEGRKM